MKWRRDRLWRQGRSDGGPGGRRWRCNNLRERKREREKERARKRERKKTGKVTIIK